MFICYFVINIHIESEIIAYWPTHKFEWVFHLTFIALLIFAPPLVLVLIYMNGRTKIEKKNNHQINFYKNIKKQINKNDKDELTNSVIQQFKIFLLIELTNK